MNPVAAATVPLPRSQDVSGDSDSAEMGSGWATTGPAGPASPGRFPAIQNPSKGFKVMVESSRFSFMVGKLTFPVQATRCDK